MQEEEEGENFKKITNKKSKQEARKRKKKDKTKEKENRKDIRIPKRRLKMQQEMGSGRNAH